MSTSFANNSRNNQTDFLPSSIEAEQAVLGAILVDAEALHKVVEHVDAASFFYKKSHQSIFESFLRLSEKNENIDILTASQHLKDHNLLDEIGGRTYLSELADHAPIAANAPYYAKIIKTKSILRHMILAGNEIVELGHHSEEELDKLVDKAEQLIFGLSQSKSKDQLIHIGDLVHESWKILEEREANKNQLSGLTTGFHDFNTLTSGLQKSDLLILAARPAMGKCLHKDSKILLEDGSLKTIEEIYKAQDANLLTLSNDWKFNLTKPSDYIDDGVKPIFKVTTRSGRSITTTLTHPYLT
ncbi:MAG: replicative DNA helicase, partial [Candidatus Melainabacteria bacterium]|nr:replicative DNA helicase [Candidatus Melainabacteria bacterium]